MSAAAYTDLLKLVLTGAATPDSGGWPWEPQPGSRPAALWDQLIGAVGPGGEDLRIVHRKPIDPDLHRTGRAMPAAALTSVGLERLDSLERCVRQLDAERIPGDLIETGVWRGGAAIFMRGVLSALGDPSRRVWLADSFQGLPPPDPSAFPEDVPWRWLLPDLSVPMETVTDNFRRIGLLDDQVRFLPGWFRDTLPDSPVDQIALLRVDARLYESTFESLEALYDRVPTGGFVIIGDYGASHLARQATDDFRRDHGIGEPMTVTDWAEVLWRKRA